MELNPGVAQSTGGTVTSVSVVTANGFAGTVANPTTTPAITLTTSNTTGSVLFANANALSQDNANFFWDATNKRLGVGTSAPLWPLTSTNPVGGTNERLIAVENNNIGTGASVMRAVGFAAGNGTAYSSGYCAIWGQKGNGTYINYMNLTPFGVSFQLPVDTGNAKFYTSATTLGQSVPLIGITAGNIVQVGMNYPAADPLEIYTGATTTNITFKEKTTATTLATLTGAGVLTVSAYVKTQAVTVASLTAAATAGVGARSFVTDALGPTFGAAVVGGGAVAVPVYSDGTNWNVG